MPTIIKNGKEYKVCPRCNGKGWRTDIWYAEHGICYNCGGTGSYDMNERRERKVLQKKSEVARDYMNSLRKRGVCLSEGLEFVSPCNPDGDLDGPMAWYQDKDSLFWILGIPNQFCFYYIIPNFEIEKFVQAHKDAYHSDYHSYPELNERE